MKRLAVFLVMFFAFARIAFGAVNINTATAEELDKLKGIGPAKAAAIVEHRKKNGPFKSIEDLKNVTGIGDSTFNAIKSEITVGTRAAPTKPAAAKPAPAAAEKASTKEPAPVAKGEEKKAAPK